MRKRGFTIVELLIVIVVIAVLAAITIVAFNGIQARANNAKTTNAIAANARAIKSFYATNNRYPGTQGAVRASCLGGAAKCGNITDTDQCSGQGQILADATVNNDLKTIVTSLPEPSAQTINCNGKQFQGVAYVQFVDSQVDLFAYFKTNSCPQVSGTTLADSGSTFGDGFSCHYVIKDS